MLTKIILIILYKPKFNCNLKIINKMSKIIFYHAFNQNIKKYFF